MTLVVTRPCILGLHVMSSCSKIQTKETPKILSLPSIRGAKSISVYNVSVQQLASSGNQRIFNLRIMVVGYIEFVDILNFLLIRHA